MMKNILFIGLGGGIGSIARYLLQRWSLQVFPSHFPWGTFGVNIAGCLLIGIFWGLSFKSFDQNESWKLFLMTGICGGFTTFSAFTLESIGLLKEDRLSLFFMYVAGSIVLGLVATYLGMRLSK